MNCKLLIALAIIVIIVQVVSAAKLTHSAALEDLRTARIQVSVACENNTRLNASCVSLEQINSQTIQGVKSLKIASECDNVVVIGGTEVGAYYNSHFFFFFYYVIHNCLALTTTELAKRYYYLF